MVTVPRAQSSVVQRASPNIELNPNAPIEAFGGGAASDPIAQATSRGLNVATQIIQEERQRADDAATTEAYAKAVRKRNELLYDPKSGAMNRQGKDAFGVSKEYGEAYEKELNTIEDELATDSQKALFRKIRIQQSTDLNNDLQRHTFTEARKFEEQTTEAGLATTRDDAVLNYQNPGKVASSIELQKVLVKEQAIRNGLPAEWVALKTKDVESKTHSAVIERMLSNGQDIEAQDYFNKSKDFLSGADSATLEKSLEEGTRRGKSQRESDAIVKSTGSLSQALEKARSIEDPRLRDDTVTRVKDYYSQKKMAEDEANEQRHKQAGNIIDQTNGDLDKIPPNVWNQFTVAEKSSLKAYAKAKKSGSDIETSWDDYYNLKTSAANPALRDDFLKTNLMTYRDKLGNSEFKELIDMQTSMRQGKSGDNNLDGFMSDQQIINASLGDAGINYDAKPGTAESIKVNNFRRQVQIKMVAYERQTGKKADSTVVKQITDDLMIEGITSKGWIWDTTKRKFELEPGEKLDFRLKDIPAGERAKIEEALTKRNIPVTDDKVLQLFIAKQKQVE